MSAIRRIAPNHPAYQAALHRTTHYPAEHVSLTTSCAPVCRIAKSGAARSASAASAAASSA